MDRRALLPAFFGAMLSACRGEAEFALATTIATTAFDSVAVAGTSDALTFARFEDGGLRRVVAVTSYHGGIVEGVDLSAALGRRIDDPIPVFLAEGYAPLRALIEASTATVRVQVSALIAPVDLRDQHIAAGTNFPEHAAGAGVEDGPFLFPKLVEPTGPYAAVAAGHALLDYEVEPAWVTLAPLAKGALPQHMGIIACNDYTDRATLMQHIDPWNVASGDGFATGKSFPGYLPVGNLFIIPRDFRAFVRELELRLYVNESLRQRSPASAMVWDLDEILAQTWARQNTTWEHRGARVALQGATGAIPDRTLVMAGTPHGTIFDGISTRQKLAGALSWLWSGWSEPVATHVIAGYIENARAAGNYLKPGDRVVIHIERLGVIRNEIR